MVPRFRRKGRGCGVLGNGSYSDANKSRYTFSIIFSLRWLTGVEDCTLAFLEIKSQWENLVSRLK
jgi:hypothetical protein